LSKNPKTNSAAVFSAASDLPAEERQVIIWCSVENEIPVLSALEEYGFKQELPTQQPAEDSARGTVIGIRGKILDIFLIKLQQNGGVAAVEILK